MTNRRGVTLVEVLVAVAILGLALAPVVGMMHKSFSDIRSEKDEANAAAVAGQILNQILFEIPFDNIVSNSYSSPGPPAETILPSGSKTVDGTLVSWTVDRAPMTNLKFLFRRLKYHPPDAGQEPAPTWPPVDAQFYKAPAGQVGADAYQLLSAPNQIDNKFSSLPSVLYELKLTIGWRPPGAAADTKKEMLYVRRAKLD